MVFLMIYHHEQAEILASPAGKPVEPVEKMRRLPDSDTMAKHLPEQV
jgi:aminoglycoside phosphotransferase family enzyme